VSPYLQQPLRSFEQAQQDREHQTADAPTAGPTVAPYATSIRHKALLELGNIAAAELPTNS
jgi:hypothetical protein